VKNYFFTTLLFLTLSNVWAQAPTDSALHKVIARKFGPGFTAHPNAENSFVLFIREDVSKENNLPLLQYAVLRTTDRKIVEEGAVTLSELRWSGNYEIEIHPMRGQVQLNRTENSVVRKIDIKKHIAAPVPK
jgi:hypothetical protein